MDQSPFLDLRVGRYSLALESTYVLGIYQVLGEPVLQDFDGRRQWMLDVRGAMLPFMSLCQELEGGDQRTPFVVALEADGEPLAIGVEAVGHVRGDASERVPIPAFGLSRPELFRGAVRTAGRILLEISPLGVRNLVVQGPGSA